MSKDKKILLIAAVSLLIVGSIIFAGAMAALGFDFMALSTQRYETNTYEISEDFDNISIDVPTAEILFAVSDDEKCHVQCLEQERLKHSVSVKDETLVINTVDTQKWYDHIGLFGGNNKLTISLPKSAYASLSIDTDIGNVKIPAEFAFESVRIKGSTADIACRASASDNMEIITDTGNIHVDYSVAGAIRLTAGTGNINIRAIGGAVCKSFYAVSDTGNITARNVVAENDFQAKSDTGNVNFEGCDAGSITIKTDIGDITGTLLSEKVFITKTDLGDVDVPKTASGGRCEVTTDVGDIRISVTN